MHNPGSGGPLPAPSLFAFAGFLSNPTVAVAAASVMAAASAAAYLLYQQRGTLFGNRGYSDFERRYAAQLKTSRQQVVVDSLDHCAAAAEGGAGPSAPELELSSLARVKVIYGSSSGNAEAFARDFVTTLNDRGVSVALIDPSRWPYLEHYTRQSSRTHTLFQFPRAPEAAKPSAAEGSGHGGGRRDEGQRLCGEEGAAGADTPQEVLLFVVSTAGEGEMPSNFEGLHQEMQLAVLHGLKTAHPEASVPSHLTVTPATTDELLHAPVFPHVKYAVFALGDKSYKCYCHAGMTVDMLLRMGGGQELLRLSCGDAGDGADLEDSFEAWQETLLPILERQCGIRMTAGSMQPPRPRLSYVTFPPSGEGGEGRNGTPAAGVCTGPAPFPAPLPLFEPSQHRPALLRLIGKEQLTPARGDGDGSAVYRFVFSVKGSNTTYQAGDHLAVYPMNPPAVVDRCAALLGLSERDLATEVELQERRTRTAMGNTLPARVTLRTALSYYADLCGKPKKCVLRVLAKYCADATEKEAFLKAVDADPIASGTRSCHRTVLDYMARYPSCCGGAIPVGHFLEVTPRIRARYYSIATDSMTHPHEVQIYVRVWPGGLASGYLASRVVGSVDDDDNDDNANDAGDHPHPRRRRWQQDHDRRWHDPSLVFAYVRVSTFHLPASLSPATPMLLIGPGTGAAAMIGLLYRREALMRRQPDSAFADCLFFFGARHEATEFFVRDEVRRWSMAPEAMEARDAADQDAPIAAAARRARNKGCLRSPVISLLECAFSRDEPGRTRVTDLIRKHSSLVYRVIVKSKGGMIFVSGDASAMAKDVNRTLLSVIEHEGKMERASAAAVLAKMESEHRYLKDVY